MTKTLSMRNTFQMFEIEGKVFLYAIFSSTPTQSIRPRPPRRVYPWKTMSKEGSVGPDPQFIEIFLAINSMVEEMYRDFRKHKDKDSSCSKQDKEEDESHFNDHPKGKGKDESFLAPPNSPVHNKKASLIKLNFKFDLPIYDGELNAKKLDNWIRQIDFYCRVQNFDSNKSKI